MNKHPKIYDKKYEFRYNTKQRKVWERAAKVNKEMLSDFIRNSADARADVTLK